MRDELDDLIDGALAEYSNVEPLAGLEERVIGRVRAERRPRRWWWAVVPVAVGAAMAAGVLMRPRVQVPPPVVAVVKPAPPPVVLAPPAPAPRVVKRERSPARSERATGLPKRDAFPTSAPLSATERLLVQLAESRPEDLAKPAAPAGDLEIKPIEIAPLTVEALDNQGGQ